MPPEAAKSTTEQWVDAGAVGLAVFTNRVENLPLHDTPGSQHPESMKAGWGDMGSAVFTIVDGFVRIQTRRPKSARQHRWLMLGVGVAVFTNRVEDLRLQDLAEVDVQEKVTQVQEFFGDFAVLDPHHFAIQLPKPAAALQPLGSNYNDRCAASFHVIWGSGGLEIFLLAVSGAALQPLGSSCKGRCVMGFLSA